MSTMVLMPVRVKPPPADTGDTISPGWASLLSATPRNGARITVSSIAVCCSATCRSATSDLLAQRGDAGDERVDLGLRLVHVGRGGQPLLRQPLAAAEHEPRLLQPDLRLRGPHGATASSWACARSSIARTVESSSRASTWPSRTAMPSSTFTSTTLPVTLEDTVARRRAVT